MNGFPVHVAHRGREAVTFSARRQDVADDPEETIPSESFDALDLCSAGTSRYYYLMTSVESLQQAFLF